MENEREWLSQITSPDPHTRILALEPILEDIHARLVISLTSKLDSRQLAEDYVQEISIRACTAIRNERLKEVSSPIDVEKYIWGIARNWLTDHFRRTNVRPTHIGYEDYLVGMDHEPGFPRRNVEHRLIGDWNRARLRNLCQHLPDEAAQISMLLALSGLSPRQISWLVPWSESKVRRHITDSEWYFVHLYSGAPEYALLPGKREQILSFVDGDGFPGITFANADPKHFSGQTAGMLCRHLGLKSIGQLSTYYNPLLVINKAYTEYATIRLSFLSRSDVGMNVLEGAPLLYLDSIPTFAPDSQPGRGRKKEMLWLDDVREFRAWIVDRHESEQHGVHIVDWIYDIPNSPLHMRKLFNPAVFNEVTERDPALIYFHSRELSAS